MAKTESGRRKLKPVIEKKRRDRINQNLAVLRALLFNSTADTRLQNPKLEKAEILDLAVQYIRKNTRDKTDNKGSVNQTVIEVTHTHTNSSNHVSAAHVTQRRVSDFESERENSTKSLEYCLDRQHSHSPSFRGEPDMKSLNSHTKPCTTVSHSYTQDRIFTDSSSVASKSACQNPIVFTPSEELSPPPSPLYIPIAPSMSPPSFSFPLFTTAFSVCSLGGLPQPLHLHKPRALTTSLTLHLDTREVFSPSQSTWRPWS